MTTPLRRSGPPKESRPCPQSCRAGKLPKRFHGRPVRARASPIRGSAKVPVLLGRRRLFAHPPPVRIPSFAEGGRVLARALAARFALRRAAKVVEGEAHEQSTPPSAFAGPCAN